MPATPAEKTPATDANPNPTRDGTPQAQGNGSVLTVKTDDVAAQSATKGTYTVAPGRTVDGKAPGETVDLDEGDARRLLQLGFILDKDGSVIVRADGPAVNVEDGVQIAQPA